MAAPDLNIDLGELPDEPPELYRLAHRVNVACGGHAGSAASMREAIARARAAGAALGAHPSYEDRVRFGRVEVPMAPADLRAMVAAQCRALAALAAEAGVVVAHVKPHGALYHAAARDPAVARSVVDGALEGTQGAVTIVGPPAGALGDAARARGIAYLREGFADRRYQPDGSLAPRAAPDALIAEPARAAAQAVALARAGGYDTLCVHGDSPGAVDLARAVRAALDGLAG